MAERGTTLVEVGEGVDGCQMRGREIIDKWWRAGREVVEKWQRSGREVVETWWGCGGAVVETCGRCVVERSGREMVEEWCGLFWGWGGRHGAEARQACGRSGQDRGQFQKRAANSSRDG